MDITLTPYLMLEGRAKEAVEFYKDVFDAEVESCELLKDWPDEFDGQVPEGLEDNVMHAHLNIAGSQLMMADAFPGQKIISGSSVTIMIDVKEVSVAEKLFSLLLDGGTEIMPLQATGFTPALGQVKDKFGVEWQIISDFPDEDE